MRQIHASNKHINMFSHELNSNTCRQTRINTHGLIHTQFSD